MTTKQGPAQTSGNQTDTTLFLRTGAGKSDNFIIGRINRMEANMLNLATQKQPSTALLQYGSVLKSDSAPIRVATDTAAFQAGVAASCLVRPEPGDKVLVSIDELGGAYVLAVLERARHRRRPTCLVFDGEVRLQVRNGGLAVAADQAVTLAAGEVELDAHAGKMRIGALSFAGKIVETQVENVKLVANALSSVIRRTVQRVTSSYRYVEEHDEIQSSSTRMLVDGTLTMQTKNTMHTAEGHIKIDAEQIHLG